MGRPSLLVLILFFTLPPAICTPAEGIALYERLREGVVTVSGRTPAVIDGHAAFRETSGAGVILDPQGTIATNTHVIYGATFITVTLRSGVSAPANVLFVSRTEDLSLLGIVPPAPLSPVEWADSNLVRLGDEIITLGHSQLLKHTISGGRIRAIGVRQNDPSQAPEFLELDINHYQGDSGGPVFDRQGRFLGLISAKRLSEDKACIAVPSNKVHFAYINLAQPEQNR